MIALDAFWSVVAVAMIALFYRKSISVITNDKATFLSIFVG
jgi:hypothetical protein